MSGGLHVTTRAGCNCAFFCTQIDIMVSSELRPHKFGLPGFNQNLYVSQEKADRRLELETWPAVANEFHVNPARSAPLASFPASPARHRNNVISTIGPTIEI
jgi:hypothetical protein